MKKFMMSLALIAMSMTAFAQNMTEVPTRKYHVVTNSFWANWYLQAGFAGNASYTSQQVSGLNGNPFSGIHGDLGFDVAVGKWFTPGIGLRTKFQGIWAKDVFNEASRPSKKYFNVHEDVMFNLTNIFGGYQENRVWNLSVYPGIGYMRNLSENHHGGEVSLNVGMINTFRVAKHWNVFLDIWGTWAQGSVFTNQEGVAHNYADYQKGYSRHWDKLVGATVGVTYNLGKCTWEKAPDVDALMAMNQEQLDALNAALKELQDENARLRELLAQKPAKEVETVVQTVKEMASTNASVFFNINKSTIASRKDLVNVKEIAEYATANGSKIVVTGYADSKTGSATYNQALSERRANTVANELVKMGVKRDNIEVVAAGGVDSLSPYSYNRRATVKIAE
ncbi:MAG: OmpA family protein [Bacteroidaceae bacterium]|nr:OmpA family protein [Bacteroidaceae bacterium]